MSPLIRFKNMTYILSIYYILEIIYLFFHFVMSLVAFYESVLGIWIIQLEILVNIYPCFFAGNAFYDFLIILFSSVPQ